MCAPAALLDTKCHLFAVTERLALLLQQMTCSRLFCERPLSPCVKLSTAALSETTLGYCAGLLHTILFHRTLGALKPVDVDSELLELTYVRDADSTTLTPAEAARRARARRLL